MPVIYFNGDRSEEQAKGAILDNGIIQAYAVRRTDPINLIFLGGHRIDDAPSYNISEGKVLPVYRFLDGRNKVVEQQLSSDVVKSVEFNLMLPSKQVSVTDLLYQSQQNCTYDLFFAPLGCDEGCDEWFWYGEDAVFGTKQIQNAIIGYDDSEGPISMMRTVRTANQLLTYNGMELVEMAEATNALYAVMILDETEECVGCDCPYQTIVRGGAGDALAEPDLEYSVDGGATWTAIDTSAIAVDTIITDIKYVNGYLVVCTADVADADSTSGEIAYSIGIGGAMALATLDVVSTGFQTMEILGGKLYAFGDDGIVYSSCDSGVSWTKDLSSPITETIIDSAVDTSNGMIYLACDAAEAWAFDGELFTDLTAEVGATPATALLSAVVWRPGAPAFGGADGYLYENWNWDGAGTGVWVATNFGATTSIGALAGDNKGYRGLAGVDNNIYRRSVATKQQWVYFNGVTGNFTKLVPGYPLPDEGISYFLGVTDTGETARIAKCELCFDLCATSAVVQGGPPV